MKKLLLLICALMFSCAGTDYSDTELGDTGADLDELSTKESGVYANTGYGWQFGTGSANKCTTSNTQECYVPNNKTVTVWIDGTMMTAAQKQLAESVLIWWLEELNATLLDGWNYRYSNTNTANADVRVVAGSSPISQTPNGNLRKDYVKISCDNLGPVLTEDFVGAPGQYRFCNQLRATVNFTNNASKAAQLGVSPADTLTDTLGFIAAVAGGHGAINTSAPVLNSINVLPLDKFEVLNSNNVCYGNEYDPSSPTTISVLSFACNP